MEKKTIPSTSNIFADELKIKSTKCWFNIIYILEKAWGVSEAAPAEVGHEYGKHEHPREHG